MLLHDADNLNGLQIRDEILRQPDTAVVRTGGVPNVHEVLCAVHRLAWENREPGEIGDSRTAARMAGCGVCRAIICADDPPRGVGSAA